MTGGGVWSRLCRVVENALIQEEPYRVKLEVFEGPLDLLLYLIKKNELDIADIPMELVTRQYIGYLRAMRELDLDIAGEFLVMASTLLWIKSRMLLPEDVRAEEDAEEEDPRWELVRQLVEYKKFKDAAQFLGRLEESRDGVFGREGAGGEAQLGEEPEVALGEVGLFELMAAFGAVMERLGRRAPGEIVGERHTVGEKMEALQAALASEGRVALSRWLERAESRSEAVCVFLAVLEMVRLRLARAVQEAPFGEIELLAAEVPA